ncbi:hypothetical protein AVEN_142246-1 [Araneus ventricosus]|uniref:DUF4817 domain-containing protein n=1 Tax=Araneus ventricosus TaxID=182803 RepID=A0A4Y2FEJ5_ARAVE|nr:hypothetical protein AVEN_142246-1 [Araneus ventricosus]
MATVKQKACLWFHESSPIVIVQRIIRLEYRNCQSPSKNFIKRLCEKVNGTGNVHQCEKLSLLNFSYQGLMEFLHGNRLRYSNGIIL